MVASVAKSLYMPSMMTSGLLPPVSEVVPRTRTLLSCAMRSSPVAMFTPAACPLSALSELVTKPLFICCCVTMSVAPHCMVGVSCLTAMLSMVFVTLGFFLRTVLCCASRGVTGKKQAIKRTFQCCISCNRGCCVPQRYKKEGLFGSSWLVFYGRWAFKTSFWLKRRPACYYFWLGVAA